MYTNELLYGNTAGACLSMSLKDVYELKLRLIEAWSGVQHHWTGAWSMASSS